MPEEIKRYNLEQAQEEAQKLQEKISKGEAKTYEEAEKLLKKEVDAIKHPEEKKEIVLTPEQKEKKKFLIAALKNGITRLASSFKKQFINFGIDIVAFPEIKQAAIEGITKKLVEGDTSTASEIEEEFNITSEDILEIHQKLLIEALRKGKLHSVHTIKEKLNIPDESLTSPEILEAAKEGMIKVLMRGDSYIFFEIKKEFNIPDEFLTSPEVQEAAKQGMSERLAEGRINDALKGAFYIKEKIGLSEEITQEAAQKGMIKRLERGETDYVLEIKEKFHLSKETVQKTVKKGLIKALMQGDSYIFFKIKKEFNISDEFLTSPEVQEAAKQGMIEVLKRGRIDDALRVKEKFHLSEDFFDQTLLNQIKQDIQKHHLEEKIAQDIFQLIKESSGVEQYLFNSLKSLYPHISDNPDLWKKLLYPTCISQGIGAFRNLEKIREMLNKEILKDEKDWEIIKYITTQKGVQAVDLLQMTLDGTEEGILQKPLSQEIFYQEFLEHAPLPIIELYPEFEKIKEKRLSKEQERKEIEKLFVKVKELQEKIVLGKKIENPEDPIFKAVLYYTFPPATTCEREQYFNLFLRREDLNYQLPEEWNKKYDPETGEGIQDKKVEISSGGYKLKDPHNPVDTTAWQMILESIRVGNQKEIASSLEEYEKDPQNKIFFNEQIKAQIGKEIVDLWSKGKLHKNKDKILNKLYELRRFHGFKLEEDLTDYQKLMNYKEYTADTLRDLLDEFLKAYEKENKEEYERSVNKATQIKISEKGKKQIIKNIINILRNIRLDEQETNNRIKNILSRFNLHFEGNILQELIDKCIPQELPLLKRELTEEEKRKLEEEETIKNIKKYLQELLQRAQAQRSNQKIATDIANRLIGTEYKEMEKEMKKYEFQEEAEEGAKKNKLRFLVSKARTHCVAGLNMGVCVAADDKLWERPEFFNMIIFDQEQNIALGGMHYLIIEDQGKKYLSLPGINPSEQTLGAVPADKLYEEMIKYAQECAQAIDCEKVIIPVRAEIHSNRSSIQSIIQRKNYPKISLSEEKEFSYGPHYSFQDVYVVG